MSTRLILTRLDEALKPLGFVRHKAIWNRTVGNFVDVLDIQVSKSRDMATVNAGVLERSVYSDCWGDELADVVEEPNCTVRARIGVLIDKKDKWWQITGKEVAEDIINHVADYALPFINKLHSLEAMVNCLNETNVAVRRYPPTIIYLAILNHRLGHHHEACELLLEFQKKTISAEWRGRASVVCERLGCK